MAFDTGVVTYQTERCFACDKLGEFWHKIGMPCCANHLEMPVDEALVVEDRRSKFETKEDSNGV